MQDELVENVENTHCVIQKALERLFRAKTKGVSFGSVFRNNVGCVQLTRSVDSAQNGAVLCDFNMLLIYK